MRNVVTTIFCDQVRVENNGKFILIGTYTGGMTVSSFPVQGQIQPICLMNPDFPGGELKIELRSASGAQFGELEMEVEVSDERDTNMPVWLMLPPVGFTLSSPDTLELHLSANGGDPEIAGRLVIETGSPVQDGSEVTPTN